MQPPSPQPPFSQPPAGAPAPKKGLGFWLWSLIIGVPALVVIGIVALVLIGGGGSRWTDECNERAANAYNIGHPYSVKEIAKACVDRAEQLDGIGDSDSEIREILDEFGKTNQ